MRGKKIYEHPMKRGKRKNEEEDGNEMDGQEDRERMMNDGHSKKRKRGRIEGRENVRERGRVQRGRV